MSHRHVDRLINSLGTHTDSHKLNSYTADVYLGFCRAEEMSLHYKPEFTLVFFYNATFAVFSLLYS